VRDLLVKRPAATFSLRMRGGAQTANGLHDGDVLVVDRSLTPHVGQLVIVTTEGELRVTRWQPQPSSTDPEPQIGEATLWGVVTYVIHKADAIGGDAAADALDVE
jgi:DNA polymerase V